VGRNSSVSIATRYGLDGPEIEFRRVGARFSAPVQNGPGAHPTSYTYNGYRVFPGGKAAEAWRLPPTPSSTEVKEREELYIYSPSGSSWLVLGWTLKRYFHYLDARYNSLWSATFFPPFPFAIWSSNILNLYIIYLDWCCLWLQCKL
jgi:hypothetical protein